MTREEFINDINTVSTLWQFAYEHDLEYYFDDIITWDDRDSEIYDNAMELLRCDGWRDCMNYLIDRDNDGEYDYYERDGFDLHGLSDDESRFEELKEEILEACDDRDNFWDEDKTSDVITDEEYEIEESELSDFLAGCKTKVA